MKSLFYTYAFYKNLENIEESLKMARVYNFSAGLQYS